MDVAEMTFIAWFTIELLFRAYAERTDLILGSDKYWNLFDVFLVAISIVEKFLLTSQFNLSFMRIFRVFRLVRVVRVVRTVKWLQHLRTMVFSVINSFIS